MQGKKNGENTMKTDGTFYSSLQTWIFSYPCRHKSKHKISYPLNNLYQITTSMPSNGHHIQYMQNSFKYKIQNHASIFCPRISATNLAIYLLFPSTSSLKFAITLCDASCRYNKWDNYYRLLFNTFFNMCAYNSRASYSCWIFWGSKAGLL